MRWKRSQKNISGSIFCPQPKEHLPWDTPDQNPKYKKNTFKRYAEVFSCSVIYQTSTKYKGYKVSTDVNFYADLISGHLVYTNVVFCLNHVFCLSFLAFKVAVLILSLMRRSSLSFSLVQQVGWTAGPGPPPHTIIPQFSSRLHLGYFRDRRL